MKAWDIKREGFESSIQFFWTLYNLLHFLIWKLTCIHPTFINLKYFLSLMRYEFYIIMQLAYEIKKTLSLYLSKIFTNNLTSICVSIKSFMQCPELKMAAYNKEI